MTDQGNEPTRVDVPMTPSTDQPTQAGVPPVPPPAAPRGTPGGEPPDRRPWIILGLLAAIALAVILLLVLASDDDDDDDATATTTTPSSDTTTTSTSSSTTTTTTTTTSTTTTAPTTTEAPSVTVDPARCAEAGADPADPQPAALAVYGAWVAGDARCAAELMGDDAHEELFERDGTGATDQFQGCFEVDEPDPHMDCAFTYEGGSTHYRMQYSPTDGWQVYDVEQIAD